MRRRDMLAGAALALALAVPAAPAVAADYTIKIAYETSETHLKARTAAMFAEEVQALSGGRIAVEIHPNASLLPSKQEVNAAASCGVAATFAVRCRSSCRSSATTSRWRRR